MWRILPHPEIIPPRPDCLAGAGGFEPVSPCYPLFTPVILKNRGIFSFFRDHPRSRCCRILLFFSRFEPLLFDTKHRSLLYISAMFLGHFRGSCLNNRGQTLLARGSRIIVGGCQL